MNGNKIDQNLIEEIEFSKNNYGVYTAPWQNFTPSEEGYYWVRDINTKQAEIVYLKEGFVVSLLEKEHKAADIEDVEWRTIF